MDVVMVDAKALQELTEAVRDMLEQKENLVEISGHHQGDAALSALEALACAFNAFEGLPGDV